MNEWEGLRPRIVAECPNCGCQDCQILRRPQQVTGQWWGQIGKARCSACFEVFPIQSKETQPTTTLPPLEHHKPLVDETRQDTTKSTREAQPPVTPPPPRYRVFCCSDCGGKLKVTTSNTKTGVRYLKCPGCGATFKLIGEERVELR